VIELYFWPTPNGYKVLLCLEEVGTAYQLKPVDIGKGQQFTPEFLRISPNNRIPAIVDLAPEDGGEPISVFESGAILVYLAEKTGRLMPIDVRGRCRTLQWLFWQVGGLGPMAGQNHHFVQYAPERIPYAIDRYVKETNRLYGVLDRQLAGQAYLAGEQYSIADIATYPWIVPHSNQLQNLDHFVNLKRWFGEISAREATERAYRLGPTVHTGPVLTEESRAILFGQDASTVR
jgi:GST-like protein